MHPYKPYAAFIAENLRRHVYGGIVGNRSDIGKRAARSVEYGCRNLPNLKNFGYLGVVRQLVARIYPGKVSGSVNHRKLGRIVAGSVIADLHRLAPSVCVIIRIKQSRSVDCRSFIIVVQPYGKHGTVGKLRKLRLRIGIHVGLKGFFGFILWGIGEKPGLGIVRRKERLPVCIASVYQRVPVRAGKL